MPLKLPVLMYHSITASGQATDILTVTQDQLEQQLRFIKEQGYTTISVSQLIDHQLQQKPLPSKPVLLTFDDGYRDNFLYLYPLLQQYNMKATIFLVASFVTNPPAHEPAGKFMVAQEITGMKSDWVEFGLHSYDHSSYSEMTTEQIAADIDKCVSLFNQQNIPTIPAMAYTYGARPKSKADRAAMYEVFRKKNIQLAFRIGNRINSLPLRHFFEVQRIDIRGTESFATFKRKLKYGGRKLLFF